MKAKALLEELQWKDVRGEVAKRNAELAKIIDEISPSAEYTLFKARYPFGSEILKNGILHLPDRQGVLQPLNNSQIERGIQDKLNYNFSSNPVSIILKNSAEIFMIFENNIVPLYGLIYPGKIFGTWRVLSSSTSHNPAFLWSMTAGARSLFMLPKISEMAGYNKLHRVFHLRTGKPKSLLDHWSLFREIVNHPDFGESWTVEILYFSKKWFEQLNDRRWQDFKNYLLQAAWDGSDFLRNQFIWDIVFSVIQKNRNIKPDPYRADTVKHLLAIGVGGLPGFAPAIDDTAAPIRQLQKIFTMIYQLENYAPIIMQPHAFSLDDKRPIYYSLQYPTTMKFSPRLREGATKIADLYQIMLLLNKYLADIQENILNLNGTPIYDLVQKIKYDFFHTDVSHYNGIRSSKEIPAEDSSFTYILNSTDRAFPSNSAFVRGCVRIATN